MNWFVTKGYLSSGFPISILLVLAPSATQHSGTHSISTAPMAAGWQFPTLQLVILFPSGLEVTQRETFITKRNSSCRNSWRRIPMAIQCFGILMINSFRLTGEDLVLRDRGTVTPMRWGIMGRKKTLLLHSFIAWDRFTLEGTGPFSPSRSFYVSLRSPNTDPSPTLSSLGSHATMTATPSARKEWYNWLNYEKSSCWAGGARH